MRGFDVGRALRAWRELYPVRGERIVVLRGMLYDCESERTVTKQGHTAKECYQETARRLRLMLEADAAEREA